MVEQGAGNVLEPQQEKGATRGVDIMQTLLDLIRREKTEGRQRRSSLRELQAYITRRDFTLVELQDAYLKAMSEISAQTSREDFEAIFRAGELMAPCFTSNENRGGSLEATMGMINELTRISVGHTERRIRDRAASLRRVYGDMRTGMTKAWIAYAKSLWNGGRGRTPNQILEELVRLGIAPIGGRQMEVVRSALGIGKERKTVGGIKS